jgi:hypothetical protein
VGLTGVESGSARGLYLLVPDLEAARAEPAERGVGVGVGEIRHKTPVDIWQGGFGPGLDPQRRDYASFAGFTDPDGNAWTLQERGFRPPEVRPPHPASRPSAGRRDRGWSRELLCIAGETLLGCARRSAWCRRLER